MLKIIGIDPATKDSGYAILDGNGSHIESGRVRKGKDMGEGEGYLFHFSKYKEMIEKHNVTHIACEDQFGSANRDTFKKLSRMTGCVLMMASDSNIPLKMYYPSQWRLKTHKAGNVDKEFTRAWANKKYDLEIKKSHNDISDAIGIAYAGYLDIKADDFESIN